MTSFNMDYWTVLFLFGCLYRETGAEAEDLEICTVGTSIGSTHLNKNCKGSPKLEISSQASAAGAFFEDDADFFAITLSPSLRFETVPQCPVEFDVSALDCDSMLMLWASTNTGTDGAYLTIDGEGAFGTVGWRCSTSGDEEVQFFFIIERVSNDDDSDITAEGAAFLKSVFESTQMFPVTTDAGNLDVMALQKFAEVTSSTEIYFIKEEEEQIDELGQNTTGIVNNVVFKSTETMIKLSTGRYDFVTGGGGSKTMSGLPGSPACDNAYKLTFSAAFKIVQKPVLILLVTSCASMTQLNL